MGCDSVQLARFGERLYWFWGDTSVARYPLGVFHMTGATTAARPLTSFVPPLQLSYEHFRNEEGALRAVAKLPGSGPTWLSAIVNVTDKNGKEHLVGTYAKIEPPLDAYEKGLCLWDQETESFARHAVVWKRGQDEAQMPDGHAVPWTDSAGKSWLLFGNPFPRLKVPAKYEAWEEPERWEQLEAPSHLLSDAGQKVVAHTGSIAWNEHRKRWVTIFMEKFGKPSAFGELWYAEAKSPFGPWGPAIKVLSHQNYTFYNPRIHPELAPQDASFLLFEGTYTVQFADGPDPTPRYDYNQILYRVDLDDVALRAARVK